MNTESYQEFLEKLLSDFRREDLCVKNKNYEIVSGDGDKTVAYLAVRIFQGMIHLYRDWLLLRGNKDVPGTPTVLEILYLGHESWVVRDALMCRWYKAQGLYVPRPPQPNMVWINNGGFPKLVTEAEAKAIEDAAAAAANAA